MIANKAFTCVEMSEERIYTGDYEFIKEAGEYIAICRYCPASKKSTKHKDAIFSPMSEMWGYRTKSV